MCVIQKQSSRNARTYAIDVTSLYKCKCVDATVLLWWDGAIGGSRSLVDRGASGMRCLRQLSARPPVRLSAYPPVHLSACPPGGGRGRGVTAPPRLRSLWKWVAEGARGARARPPTRLSLVANKFIVCKSIVVFRRPAAYTRIMKRVSKHGPRPALLTTRRLVGVRSDEIPSSFM